MVSPLEYVIGVSDLSRLLLGNELSAYVYAEFSSTASLLGPAAHGSGPLTTWALLNTSAAISIIEGERDRKVTSFTLRLTDLPMAPMRIVFISSLFVPGSRRQRPTATVSVLVLRKVPYLAVVSSFRQDHVRADIVSVK